MVLILLLLAGSSGLPTGPPPCTPVVARIVEQSLPTPEPTDPSRDCPLSPAPLSERVHTAPLAPLPLQTIGHTAYAKEPVDHRFRGASDYRCPHAPAARPVAAGLCDGHALRIRRAGLSAGRRGRA